MKITLNTYGIRHGNEEGVLVGDLEGTVMLFKEGYDYPMRGNPSDPELVETLCEYLRESHMEGVAEEHIIIAANELIEAALKANNKLCYDGEVIEILRDNDTKNHYMKALCYLVVDGREMCYNEAVGTVDTNGDYVNLFNQVITDSLYVFEESSIEIDEEQQVDFYYSHTSGAFIYEGIIKAKDGSDIAVNVAVVASDA